MRSSAARPAAFRRSSRGFRAGRKPVPWGGTPGMGRGETVCMSTTDGSRADRQAGAQYPGARYDPDLMTAGDEAGDHRHD